MIFSAAERNFGFCFNEDMTIEINLQYSLNAYIDIRHFLTIVFFSVDLPASKNPAGTLLGRADIMSYCQADIMSISANISLT